MSPAGDGVVAGDLHPATRGGQSLIRHLTLDPIINEMNPCRATLRPDREVDMRRRQFMRSLASRIVLSPLGAVALTQPPPQPADPDRVEGGLTV
jgi:hypothetical protein